jgi:SAM-dependent methyltransferase
MAYSGAFAELIGDEQRVQRLLAGSSFYNADFELWCNSRRFVAEVFDRGGTILDVGCGNGFLLRCLQEWSGHPLVPYGVDVSESFIREAQILFPGEPEHFLTFNALGLPPGNSFPTLPPRFDYLYWGVWDCWTFRRREEMDLLTSIEAMVQSDGKLILGFYHQDRRESFAVIGNLEQLGLSFSGIIENYSGEGVIVWQDKRAPTEP